MTQPYCGAAGSLDTLLINGLDLASYAHIVEVNGLYAPPGLVGNNLVMPNRDGSVHLDRPFESTVVTVSLALSGANQTKLNDAVRALRRLVKPGQRLALSRVMHFSTGTETHVATGEYLSGLELQIDLLRTARTTLALTLLDGTWHGPNDVTFQASGASTAVVAEGDVRTHRMTIAVSGACTVRNLTNLYGVTFDQGGVLDVEAVSGPGTLVFNKRMPFRLDPGPNTISVTNGQTATISYKPAYL